MPKMKTHSSSKKRFRITASGKVVRSQAGTSHLAPGKTQKQTRQLRKFAVVSSSDRSRIKQQLANIK